MPSTRLRPVQRLLLLLQACWLGSSPQPCPQPPPPSSSRRLTTSTVHQIVGEAVDLEREFCCDALSVALVGMNADLMAQVCWGP